jgi:hypothetical protein
MHHRHIRHTRRVNHIRTSICIDRINHNSSNLQIICNSYIGNQAQTFDISYIHVTENGTIVRDTIELQTIDTPSLYHGQTCTIETCNRCVTNVQQAHLPWCTGIAGARSMFETVNKKLHQAQSLNAYRVVDIGAVAVYSSCGSCCRSLLGIPTGLRIPPGGHRLRDHIHICTAQYSVSCRLKLSRISQTACNSCQRQQVKAVMGSWSIIIITGALLDRSGRFGILTQKFELNFSHCLLVSTCHWIHIDNIFHLESQMCVVISYWNGMVRKL